MENTYEVKIVELNFVWQTIVEKCDAIYIGKYYVG